MREVNEDGWKPERDKWQVERSTLRAGIWVYSLYDPSYVGPLGIVWGLALGNRFLVLWSYVLPSVRRMGIRSAINETILDHFKIIASPVGTPEGKAFMEAGGYRWLEEIGEYVLVRKKEQPVEPDKGAA